jgi:hypothetical protein
MARKRHTDEAEVQMSATPSPTQLFLADASATERELSPIFGDGLIDQAATVVG